jgi:hypothetical protein
MIDPGAVGGQIGAFGDCVETCEEGDAFIADQVHDLTLAMRAEKFECQQTGDGLFGGDHARAGQTRLAYDLGPLDVPHHRYEPEQAAGTGAEGARSQTQGADIGAGRWLWPKGFGAFVVESSRETGEALLPQQEGQGVDAEALPRPRQFPLNVLDGEVPFPQGDDQFPERIADRSRCRSLENGREEPGAEVGIVAELMTEDPKGPVGRAESTGDFDRTELIDQGGAQGFVLSLEGRFRGEEEVGVVGRC